MPIKADPESWAERPDFQIGLEALYQRAMDRPFDDNFMFRDTLNLPDADAGVN